ncbi:GntR family transcriptional regulator [Streptomyces xiaopingdaonensis]|uniref:GntR family transcriptional regulator n=1 Tax=Streptomyces xiaopingdaonensis TaxID=1565415 RepID=UPI0002DB4300|nr:GntR family transcriptional regulator [Streptomyces xiaopingdaonensis]
MLLEVDPAEPLPLYEQVAAGIRAAVREGSLHPGDRLPPAAELAEALDVNRHTVLKAFHLLREEGVLEFRRGRGVTVGRASAADVELHELLRQAVALGKRIGYSRKELARMIERGE